MGDKLRDRKKSKAQRDAVAGPNESTEPGDGAPTVIDPRVWRNRAKPPASTPAPPLPERGGTLGRFVIRDRVGMGGTAVVYSAYDPALDRKVAIKLLRPEVGDSWGEEARQRLLREAVALAKLSHPNVVTVYEVGEVNDQVFIAQELVKGSDLKQWMREKPRSQSEILEVFLQAGRGLAAAHAEGITHRDFKPANVFMGTDGRARVGDFGIALAEGRDATDSWRGTMSGLRRRWADWDGSLTQTGMLLGTPHYMAPEQLAGLKEGAQTDQFSFCVALYEGLYGERPFAGKFLAKLGVSLEENVLAENVRPAPKNTQVPTWLRRVLRRGLSRLPTDRYPTMEALLEELGHDPEEARRQRQAARRRQTLVLGSVALAVCGPIGAWYGIKYQRAQRCAAVETRLVGVWDGATKERIRMALLATKKPFAAGTWQRVERAFDTYTAEWTHMRAEACSATWRSGTQSEEVFDLRMNCLRRRLREVRALADIFARADATVVAKATQAATGLTAIARCADVAALQAPRDRIRPPPDEAAAKKVEAIREKLALVKSLEETGKYAEGLELATRTLDGAEALDYLPVEAEALYWVGDLQRRVGLYEEAAHTLESAFRSASVSHHDEMVARTTTLLIWVVGFRLAKHEQGLRWARLGETIEHSPAVGDAQKARRLNNMSVVRHDLGEYDKALEHYRKSLAIREKVLGPEHPDVARTLNNLGLVFSSQGKGDKALEYYRKSLAINEKALGPEHPDVATVLNNLGLVFSSQGKYDKALEYYRKSLAIREKVLGPEHPDVARTLNNLGVVFWRQGKYDKALEYYRKSLAIRQKALGPEHPDVARTLSGMGSVFLDKGMPEEALEPLARAVSICEKKTCDLEPHGRGLFALARALAATAGDNERAIRQATEARAVFGKAPYLNKELEEVNAWLKERGEE